jgi:hypothetical protein
MTVAELIQQLQKVPQDMMVVVLGYESGYDNPEIQNNGMLIPDDNWDGQKKINWYNGRHDTYYHDMAVDGVPCIVIGRGK